MRNFENYHEDKYLKILGHISIINIDYEAKLLLRFYDFSIINIYFH